ncbi:MAG: antibiotic biosynthesis monooxygenase [Candidatus Sericytochromatia bacterium]
MTPVHVAILRRVKPGQQAAFEEAVERFFKTAPEAGSLGAQLIRPLPGGDPHEYGILRSFPDPATRDRFYASAHFQDWERSIAAYVEGPGTRMPIHGLEAWFRTPNSPPRWKMALVSWSGVWPSVFGVSLVVGPFLKGLPPFLGVGISTFFVVILLTWGVMPQLTRVLRGWLHAPQHTDSP